MVANADQVAVVLPADRLDGDRGLPRPRAGRGLGRRAGRPGGGQQGGPRRRPRGAGRRAGPLPRPRPAGGADLGATGEGLDELRDALAGRGRPSPATRGSASRRCSTCWFPTPTARSARSGGGAAVTPPWPAAPWRCPDVDAWLVDTPGVRSFGLGAITAVELAQHFPELAGAGLRPRRLPPRRRARAAGSTTPTSTRPGWPATAGCWRRCGARTRGRRAATTSATGAADGVGPATVLGCPRTDTAHLVAGRR